MRGMGYRVARCGAECAPVQVVLEVWAHVLSDIVFGRRLITDVDVRRVAEVLLCDTENKRKALQQKDETTSN